MPDTTVRVPRGLSCLVSDTRVGDHGARRVGVRRTAAALGGDVHRRYDPRRRVHPRRNVHRSGSRLRRRRRLCRRRIGIGSSARRRVRIRRGGRRSGIPPRVRRDHTGCQAAGEQEQSAPHDGRSLTGAALREASARSPQQRLGSPSTGQLRPLPNVAKPLSNVLLAPRRVNRSWSRSTNRFDPQLKTTHHESTRRSSAGTAPVPAMTAPIPGR